SPAGRPIGSTSPAGTPPAHQPDPTGTPALRATPAESACEFDRTARNRAGGALGHATRSPWPLRHNTRIHVFTEGRWIPAPAPRSPTAAACIVRVAARR